ncbi:MAG: ABC transporter permease [Myxococcales bacterium]|nr:ABC transporter permease [Myxococcales bacterium]
MRAAHALWWRELVRFARQPSRVLSAVGSPLVFWLLIGSGFSGSFKLPGAAAEDLSYLEYFFPGTVVLLILFAAIFSTISVIDDRHQGFLQGVLASPTLAGELALGKVAGGATLAWIQGTAVLALAPVAGIDLDLGRFLAASGVLAMLAFALTALGFPLAWKVDSTQGFHAVMNLILVPMWFLSGALFPLSGAPDWLRAVMRWNPLTYGVSALRQALYEGARAAEPAANAWLVLAVWCGVAFAWSVAVVRRPTRS